MIKALITDVSYVLLQPKDNNYSGSLNALYKSSKDNDKFEFFKLFQLNMDLLDYYKAISNKIPIYILTSDVIQDDKELQVYWNGIIREIFSASKMGSHKSKPDAYQRVLNKLHLQAQEVLYIDDNEDNIKAASSIGLVTILHTSTKNTIQKINLYL